MRRLGSVIFTAAGLAGLTALAVWREVRLRADDARLGIPGIGGTRRPADSPSPDGRSPSRSTSSP